MVTFLASVFFNQATQISVVCLIKPTTSLPTGVDKLGGWTAVSVTVSSFVFEILPFLYYANDESDDAISRSTGAVKY